MLTRIKNWIKDKFKRFKKWFLALFIIPVVFAANFGTNPPAPIEKPVIFDWTIRANEIKELRKHDVKVFPDPSDQNKRILIQSSGLFHAYTDKGFEDIETELPNFNFPEGKDLTEPTDKHYIMDLPVWGNAKLEVDGKVRVYDKLGKSIFTYQNPTVVPKGKLPYEVFDKDGNKIKDTFDEKDVKVEETLVKASYTQDASFVIENNKMYFKLATSLTEPLQAFDLTDTSSTNAGDVMILASNPTTNYGSTNYAEIRGTGAADQRKMLITFTLSSGSGVISDISLFAKDTGTTWSGDALHAYKSLRTFTEAGATWNTYDGTNNWTTAGCESAGNDYDSTSLSNVTSGTASQWQQFAINGYAGGLTWGSTALLMLQFEPDSSAQDVAFHTKEATSSGDRPYLQITYTIQTPKAGLIIFQ